MRNRNRGIDYKAQAVKIMKLAGRFFFRIKNRRCYKRMFFAAVAIKAILLKMKGRQNLAEEYISCLKMYFIVSPEFLLSVSEVKSLLYLCFFVIKRLCFYDVFCQEFDNLMPWCPTRSEPRKLTELARCQIRYNLSQCNLSLPAILKQLNLPKKVKIFLLGDLINI